MELHKSIWITSLKMTPCEHEWAPQTECKVSTPNNPRQWWQTNSFELPRLPQTNSLQHTQTNILAMSTSSPNKQTKKKKKKKKKTTEPKVAKKKNKLYLGNVDKPYKQAEEPILTVAKKKRRRSRREEQSARKGVGLGFWNFKIYWKLMLTQRC